MNKIFLFIFVFIVFICENKAQGKYLKALASPVLFEGNDSVAFRDPAVLYHQDSFYLFFTYVKTKDDKVYSYTAMSSSKDLANWSQLKILTPEDQAKDYSSPGNVIRFQNEWIMCLQTYPRPNYMKEEMPRFGNSDARLYIMRSNDLNRWSEPELLKVKGDSVSFKEMGRMIDPYLIEDKNEKGKWWCFYKQNGVSMSYTYDFKNWNYSGHITAGENASVLYENNEYILFHSPKNGIGAKRSQDLQHWRGWLQPTILGQKDWPWAKGRITAGTVINLCKYKNFGKYLMFFHGSGPLTEEQGDFDKNASIGLAWSDDMYHWNWPR
ncbi:MAG: hypothetical protein ABIO82_04345 [Ginsengibacter sp.]